MLVKENFELMHFTESNIGKVHIHGNDLTVPVENIFVLGSHPLCERGAGPYSGKFVFHNVHSSKRELTEYIGDPKNPEGFKDPYVVEDISEKLEGLERCKEYAFEGITDDPVAWVDWCIKAESFEFECDE